MTGTQGLACLKAELSGKGYKRVRTYGGWVDLDAWTPYGQAVTKVEFATWHILAGQDLLRERTPEQILPGGASGIWELGR